MVAEAWGAATPPNTKTTTSRHYLVLSWKSPLGALVGRHKTTLRRRRAVELYQSSRIPVEKDQLCDTCLDDFRERQV